MEVTTPQWPLLVYIVAVLGLVIFMLGLSYLLGQRHKERATGEYFESGILHTGTSQIRFTAHFYLIALFFIIFDLEAVFIIAWAIAYKEVGWAGFIGVAIFILILLIVLVYEWRIGALNFAADGKEIIKRMKSIKEGEK
ncbi:NADH-quinone oxidoreductase subunit A [Caldithrix abyssi]|uniref:NADH-quinone oxidoreductase subunit A n=2 Tax=Caldithrix abyssi DSM 13497 TaxID=880073 RepID=H1XWD3_CALAY|nr:NADH-quinone oxidoreductase subunit A [Caldithrix abyssi]EHO40715.1 NAD(P)H-quinone oxidoreductase subunit 3 [Caldithrix abyssi DSM 13497]